MSEIKMNEKQKRMVIINDLACFGRCALAVSQPIISAMGIECCPLPTAVLSTNGAFPGCAVMDMASFMEQTITHWESLDIEFDGICSGFYNSVAQIHAAERLISKAAQTKTMVFLDPIMGDNGKLYSVSTEEVCDGYRHLMSYADVLTPNLTETCKLLGIEYPKETPDQETLADMTRQLRAMGPDKIVITGLDRGDFFENFIDDGGSCHTVQTKKIGSARCGTGDVFMAVLAGRMLNGDSFEEAVKQCVQFLNQSIQLTADYDLSARNGVCFEPFLSELDS